jgi:hypothetical protein
VRQVGSRVIEERKAAVLAERSASGSSLVEKQDVQGNDLLSLLVKSNIAADIPESMRLSDFEILSRKCSCSLIKFTMVLSEASTISLRSTYDTVGGK